MSLRSAAIHALAVLLGAALVVSGCLGDDAEGEGYFECGACDAFGDGGGASVDTTAAIQPFELASCWVEENRTEGDPLYDLALLKCEVLATPAPVTVAFLEVTGTVGAQGMVGRMLNYPQPGVVTVHQESIQFAYPMELTVTAAVEVAGAIGLNRSIEVSQAIHVAGPAAAPSALLFPLELWGVELVGSADMAPYRAFDFQARYALPEPVGAELVPRATIRAGQSGAFYLVVVPGMQPIVGQGRLFGGRGAEDLAFDVPITGPGSLVISANGIALGE